MIGGGNDSDRRSPEMSSNTPSAMPTDGNDGQVPTQAGYEQAGDGSWAPGAGAADVRCRRMVRVSMVRPDMAGRIMVRPGTRASQGMASLSTARPAAMEHRGMAPSSHSTGLPMALRNILRILCMARTPMACRHTMRRTIDGTRCRLSGSSCRSCSARPD